MVVAAFIIGMFMLPQAHAISFGQAKVVYLNIIHYNDIVGAPKLVLRDDDSVNAAYNKSEHTVYVNKGVLRVCGKDQIAFILSHELTHWRYKHWISVPRFEFVADKGGAELTKRAKYNVCKGTSVMRYFNQEDTIKHPAAPSRVKALNC